MNGSLPPSSSTLFLRCVPASAADGAPARSLPVSETPVDDAGSRSRCATSPGSQEEVGEDALGHAGVAEQLLDAPARTAG